MKKKIHRKIQRAQTKNAKLMFSEIINTLDCLKLIISCVVNFHNLEDIQNISKVSKIWKSVTLEHCQGIKDIRVIFKHTHHIYKGCIPHDACVPNELQNLSDREEQYCTNYELWHDAMTEHAYYPEYCWSRLVIYPKDITTVKIYEIVHKKSKTVWSYQDLNRNKELL